MKVKKKLEVFTVPWDELLRCFNYSFMPGERDDTMDELLASDKPVADLNKLEKAEREKVLKDLDERYPVLKAVELTNHGVEFTFCHTGKTQAAQPTELA
jgi:small-conductance mechanosensitive channel